jgi:uncharacterized protein DUF2510
MDLPPSGWYPDPYGVPGLLRWWDGSAWTQHTHDEGAPAPGAMESKEPPTTVQRMTPQPTTVQPAVTGDEVPVQPTTVQPAIGPAQPTAVQPTTIQPAATRQVTGEDDINGTRVLFLDDAAWNSPNTPGRPGEDERFDYYRSQRQRRIWLMSGLAGGVAVVLAVIALIVNSMGQTPASNTAAQPPTSPAAASSTAPASPSPSPTAPPTAATSGSTVTDGTSGLSFAQLATPWQPGCPSGLNGQAFTWTAGESAAAGQINNGQTTWYGAACAGALPQQYGYNGVADLENIASNLVTTFDGTYYAALPHSRSDVVSQPVSVSGHPGWEIKFLMTYTNPQGLAWNNELGAVVVADEGTGVAPAVFYTSVPANLNENNVDTLVSSLQLTTPAQPGGSPGAGSPAAGSPAALGGDDRRALTDSLESSDPVGRVASLCVAICWSRPWIG